MDDGTYAVYWHAAAHGCDNTHGGESSRGEEGEKGKEEVVSALDAIDCVTAFVMCYRLCDRI